MSVIYRSGVDYMCALGACRPLTAEMTKAITRLQLASNNLLSTLKLAQSPSAIDGVLGSQTAILVSALLRELKDVWQISGAPVSASAAAVLADGWSLDSTDIAPLTASLAAFFEQSRDAVIAVKTRSSALQKPAAPAPVRMPTQVITSQVVTPNASGGVDIADVPPKSGPDSLPLYLIVGGVVVGGAALAAAAWLNRNKKMPLRRLHRGRG